ncbi:hypothetical protein AVEN_221790-1 [Araneus ventricosus]|uniref:Uncharacterized protein n=1 Tax=Araneus ventricosus TaxID=182803 RepID=A0A4Y2R170_ARAVE|nr:hypothetical protein AVEN_221790-1 [Araneus ventricosus]
MHGDSPWANKLALVGHHLGSGWIVTGRTTLHGDLGFLEPFGQLHHWKTAPPSAPANGLHYKDILCEAGNHEFHCSVEIRHCKLSLRMDFVRLRLSSASRAPARIFDGKTVTMMHSGTIGRDIQACQLLDIGQVLASRGIPSNLSLSIYLSQLTKNQFLESLSHIRLLSHRRHVSISPVLFLTLAMINSFLPLSQPESPRSSKTAIFESPGENRQATPNRQIFKTGKGTVRIKFFLPRKANLAK